MPKLRSITRRTVAPAKLRRIWSMVLARDTLVITSFFLIRRNFNLSNTLLDGESRNSARADRQPGRSSREPQMKIIAYDNFKPGVVLDDLRPYLREEVSNVWRLWKAGV